MYGLKGFRNNNVGSILFPLSREYSKGGDGYFSFLYICILNKEFIYNTLLGFWKNGYQIVPYKLRKYDVQVLLIFFSRNHPTKNCYMCVTDDKRNIFPELFNESWYLRGKGFKYHIIAPVRPCWIAKTEETGRLYSFYKSCDNGALNFCLFTFTIFKHWKGTKIVTGNNVCSLF